MNSKEKILVTGAGGFIGGWLAETLYLSNASSVRAGVHSWAGAVRPARFPMEIVLCDILNPQQIADAVEGVNCVIHCAKGASPESIIQGTRNLLEASLQHGVQRFIHIGTTEVYGRPIGNIDETFPFQTFKNSYADCKIEAEKICWEFYSRGLPLTVIRPPIVYGPFGETWTVNIAQKLQSGNWGTFKKNGEGICNLIYISDLVTGILMAARDKRAIGEVFNMNGPEMLTWNEYFQRYNAILGLPDLPLIETGDARMRAMINEPLRTSIKYVQKHFMSTIKNLAAHSRLARQAMKFVEQKMKTSPRPTDFSLFSLKAFYVSNKAQEMLGFRPRFNLDAGLALTLPWLKQVGLLDQN
jgi:nucleoside-diphosphate-sugar epimerase